MDSGLKRKEFGFSASRIGLTDFTQPVSAPSSRSEKKGEARRPARGRGLCRLLWGAVAVGVSGRDGPSGPATGFEIRGSIIVRHARMKFRVELQARTVVRSQP